MNKYKYQALVLFLSLSMISIAKPEYNVECDAPRIENHSGLSIAITHCVDYYGPGEGGTHQILYDYETIVFEMGNEFVSGKRYSDTPNEASLTRIRSVDGERFLEKIDFGKDLLKSSISYLQRQGAKTIKYLDKSNEIDGYSLVPTE